MGNSATKKPVATIKELKEAKKNMIRVRVPCGGRDKRQVLLVLIEEKVHAIDGKCYHAGAPLETGDIEELGERMCVKCPRHGYCIDVKTGEHVKAQQAMTDTTIKSLGKRHRTHTVRVDDQGGVFSPSFPY
eukprot:CAMPEP_0184480908 /NCGR_PEP_ID=MMETSP0113_2-20130426/2432_1 /TAXON_ID=91329 /ORGANISM="Norrisiella sphaerica, Strain BC52" /LENGTH=130 /DNA_ID=CAMNT_0026859703 /DNA_START=123 /DNA_END=515 /DNA_ORIENTATION=-